MSLYIATVLSGVAVLVLFQCLKKRTARKVATFHLYSVRDDLICLVAEGKLEENSKIFQYYYKRINMILKHAPNVGLDDAMRAFITINRNSSFDKSLDKANKETKEMFKVVSEGKETEEVRNVIANYYSAAKHMMLAHSSVSVMLYLLLIKSPVSKLTQKIASKSTNDLIKMVNFVEEEEHKFRQCTP